MQPGPILLELDWNDIPSPFITTILAQLEMEHPDYMFKVLTVPDLERGVIIAAEINTDLSRMLNNENKIVTPKIMRMFLNDMTYIEAKRKVDFAYIFSM